MKKIIPTLLGFGLFVAQTAQLSAAPTAYDSFSYVDGVTLADPANTGGFGWAAGPTGATWIRDGGGTNFNTTTPGLSYGTLATAGNSVADSSNTGGAAYHRNQAINPLSVLAAGEDTWISYLINVSSLGTASFTDANTAYLGWNGAGGNATNAGSMVKSEIRNFTTADGGATGTFDLFARNGNSATSATSLSLNLNTTYLIAMRYVQDFSGVNDLLEVYNVATSDIGLSFPSVASTSISLTGLNFNKTDFTQIGFNSQLNAATFTIDEIRTGFDFSDVVVAVPEPSAFALLGGAIGLFGAMRLRRRRA